MTLTGPQVLAALDAQPRRIGDIGLRLVGAEDPDGQPVGQFLAARGVSLSGVQKVVDDLVRAGLAVELRGRELWDRHLPGLGPDARGRHYARR